MLIQCQAIWSSNVKIRGDIMIIYKITCKANNKIYIGQTSESLKQRFSRHMGYQKDDHDTKFYEN